jgi:hypothetical protein
MNSPQSNATVKNAWHYTSTAFLCRYNITFNPFSLTFNGQVGQCSPGECIFFSSQKENAVLQWAFKLNSAPATAGMWGLKGHMLKVIKL